MTALQELYKHIPIFACEEGCHDCCERPMFGPDEWDAIEEKRAATGPECPYVSEGKCAIYDQRPLVCRLFGAVDLLPCPRGRGPTAPLSEAETTALAREYVDLVGDRKMWCIGHA